MKYKIIYGVGNFIIKDVDGKYYLIKRGHDDWVEDLLEEL